MIDQITSLSAALMWLDIHTENLFLWSVYIGNQISEVSLK